MNKSIQGKADASGSANGIVDQAKQTVANVASDAKAGVQTQLEQKIDHAKGIGIEKIETVSEALRGAGEKLEGTGPLPDLANKAAEGIENLAHYFENKDISDVFRGVERFARREPALFLGGAVALGVIAGRFLKSSGRRSRSESEYAYAGSGGEIDRYESFGYEGEYGVEGDYLSADDLEDEWDTASDIGSSGTIDEPMAFESEDRGIGTSSSSSSSYRDATRTTQPQGSSFGGATIGSSRGNTEKMPVTQGATQGSIGGGTTASSGNTGGSTFGSEEKTEKTPSDDFSSFNKSSR